MPLYCFLLIVSNTILFLSTCWFLNIFFSFFFKYSLRCSSFILDCFTFSNSLFNLNRGMKGFDWFERMFFFAYCSIDDNYCCLRSFVNLLYSLDNTAFSFYVNFFLWRLFFFNDFAESNVFLISFISCSWILGIKSKLFIARSLL